jgi:hypothetical protein
MSEYNNNIEHLKQHITQHEKKARKQRQIAFTNNEQPGPSSAKPFTTHDSTPQNSTAIPSPITSLSWSHTPSNLQRRPLNNAGKQKRSQTDGLSKGYDRMAKKLASNNDRNDNF